MSFAVDTNILVYASDGGSRFRGAATRFLTEATLSADVLFLALPVIVGYVRTVTDPTIFGAPLKPAEAQSNIDSLLSFPNIRVLPEDRDVWETYRSVAAGVVVRGSLVSDAYLAALLRHHGVRVLYTNDSDFRKFDFLEVRNPFR
jgi:toxin-antitoxin system PIN domain toxin